MSATIGRLTKAKKDNTDPYWIVSVNGTYAQTHDGKRIVVHAFTRRNAIHQAKQMVGYEARVVEAGEV